MGDRPMRLSGLLLLMILPLGVAWAETDQERRAREDLERQLKAMVGTPPTKVRIELVGLDQPNYELLAFAFKLDGRSLPVAADPNKLTSDGVHLIFHGDIEPGDHRLEAKFEFRNRTSNVVSAEGGYVWKPGTERTFRAERGIEVELTVIPELNPSADLKNRITVKSLWKLKMLANLDDGKMPPPAEKPKLVFAEADAGVGGAEKPLTAAEAKQKAREEALAAKKAAAEEKARVAAEAKAARQAAAEEKKAARLAAAEEKKAARLAAAEQQKASAAEKKAARLAAAEEKKAAAEEKKRAAEEAKRPKVAAAEPVPQPAEPAAAPEVAAAPEPAAVAEADAGAVAELAKPVTAEPVLAEPVEEPSALPVPLLVAVGVAVVGLLLFVLARRRRSVPRE